MTDDSITTALQESLAKLRDATGAHGTAGCVVVNGTIVATDGFGVADARSGAVMSAETTFEIASQTKLITTLALLRLAEAGSLSTSDSVRRYIDADRFVDPVAAESVSLDHCMRHSAGFTHVTNRRGLLRPLHATGLSIQRRRSSSCLVSGDGPLQLHAEPGRATQYSNVGSALLAEVLEHATGMPYADAARELVLEPLGMTRTTIGMSERPQAPRYGGRGIRSNVQVFPRWKGIAGAISTISDIGRLIAPYTSDHPDQCGVSRETLERTLQPIDRDPGLPGHVVGWRREVSSRGVVLHQAGTQPGMTVKAVCLPTERTAVVLLANNSARPEIHGAAMTLAHELTGEGLRSPARSSADGSLTGTFRIEGTALNYPTFWSDCGPRLTIVADDGGLTVRSNRLEDTPVLSSDGQVGFRVRGAFVPLHTIQPPAQSDLLILGGPYTGVRLRRTA